MKIVKLLVVVVGVLVLSACGEAPKSTIYEARMKQFEAHPATPGKPMMIGDSITYLFGLDVSWPAGWTNRGISGDTTGGVLKRLDYHLLEKPSEIVLLIGANNFNRTVGDYIADMTEIIQRVRIANVPLTVVSVLPRQVVEYDITMRDFNAALKPLCDQYNVRFVDIYSDFTDGHGSYDSSLFMDTVHPNAKGYEKMCSLFKDRHVIEN